MSVGLKLVCALGVQKLQALAILLPEWAPVRTVAVEIVVAVLALVVATPVREAVEASYTLALHTRAARRMSARTSFVGASVAGYIRRLVQTDSEVTPFVEEASLAPELVLLLLALGSRPGLARRFRGVWLELLVSRAQQQAFLPARPCEGAETPARLCLERARARSLHLFLLW